jgi:hypothetical protein
MKYIIGLFCSFLIFTSFLVNGQGPVSCNPTADPNQICQGDTSQLNANAYGGSGNYTYAWTSNPPGFSSEIPSPVVIPSQTTVYLVIVDDGIDTAQGSVTVTVNPSPQPDLGPDTLICEATYITLNANCVADFFTWSTGQFGVSSITVSDSGTYWVRGRFNDSGCTGNDTTHVGFYSTSLDETALVITPTFCNGYNGSISGLTILGFPPYAFQWQDLSGNNFGTGIDVYNLPAGNYILTITDGHGCESVSPVYTIIDAGNLRILQVQTTSPHCSFPDGQLIIHAFSPSGSAMEYSIDDGMNYSSDSVFTGLPAGIYVVRIRDTNGCAAFYSDNPVILEEIPSSIPTIYSVIGGGLICYGSTGIEISLDGSDINTDYELFWNAIFTGTIVPGTGFPISFGLQNLVGDYSVMATDVASGCKNQMENSANIEYINLSPDPICLVTVDSTSGKNIVLWEKTMDDIISSYNIYRESTSVGIFDLIGNVGHDNISSFVDEASNPLQRSFSYGLTTLDTCGDETSMSSVHTTMHLNINTGINSYNLIWTPYSGFSYQTYYIYRRQASDGFQILDSVPNTVLSYTDLIPPEGLLDYVIEIRNENDCDTQKGGKSYLPVFSNIISTNVGIEEQESWPCHISAFPNPFSGSTSISYWLNNESHVNIRIENQLGQTITELVREKQSKGMHQCTWNAEGLPAGIYFYHLTAHNQSYAGKMMLVR